MSRENVEVVQRIYDALNRGQSEEIASDPRTAELVAELFDPEVVLEQLADIPGTSGTFRGYQGLLQSSRELVDALEDIRFEPEDFIEQRECVVVPVRASATGRESGVPVDLRIAHVWELRGGRVVRWVVYGSRAEALEAVGLQE